MVVASDRLWNVMSPQAVVNFIYDYDNEVTNCNQSKDVVSAIIKEALKRWDSKNELADNIAVLIAFLSKGEKDKSSSVTSKESFELFLNRLHLLSIHAFHYHELILKPSSFIINSCVSLS